MAKSIAIPEARRRSRSPVPTSAPGFCKREVRECYRIAVSRSLDAAEAWANAKHKHREDDPMRIPRGVPVFWLGGSDGHGHVSIATGRAGHWTTDLLRPGWFDRTGIRLVSLKWPSLRLVGWTEDLDDVRVWRDGESMAPRVFALSANELNGIGDVVHDIDDREEVVARRHGGNDDALVVAARAWMGDQG